jgi:hypothetical protein
MEILNVNTHALNVVKLDHTRHHILRFIIDPIVLVLLAKEIE